MFLIDLAIIWLGAALMYAFREQISHSLLKTPPPTWLLFSSVLLFLIVVEESINCIDYNDGLGCRMTPWINTVLFLYVTLFAVIAQKYGRISFKALLLSLCLFGTLWEVFAGGLRGLPPGLFYILMLLHVFLSYAFISVIPLAFIKSEKKVHPHS